MDIYTSYIGYTSSGKAYWKTTTLGPRMSKNLSERRKNMKKQIVKLKDILKEIDDLGFDYHTIGHDIYMGVCEKEGYDNHKDRTSIKDNVTKVSIKLAKIVVKVVSLSVPKQYQRTMNKQIAKLLRIQANTLKLKPGLKSKDTIAKEIEKKLKEIVYAFRLLCAYHCAYHCAHSHFRCSSDE